MTTSSTYAIDYDVAAFTEEAFERCGIDPATLVSRHMRSARMSLNLMFSQWATAGVRLFVVDEQTQTLTASTASYSAATGTLAMLETIVRRSGIDMPLTAIDRGQYHAIPDKTMTGLPSQFYYDARANTYKLWSVPENSTDVLRYYRLRRIQDVTAGMETTDVPFPYFEALTAGLAEKLALKHAPDRFDRLAAIAAKRLAEAIDFDRQRTSLTFSIG